MENKFEIIETPDYILAVSDEERGVEGYNYNFGLSKINKLTKTYPTHSTEWNFCKKIIAYQPKGNAKELLFIVQYGNMTFKELNGDGSYYECIDCKVQTIRSGEFLKSQGIELYKNAPELDLPLLPEIVIEDDVEKLAENYKNKKGSIPTTELEDEIFKLGFKDGYKAATKKYSEDDLRKAFEAGMRFVGEDKGSYEEFIQSLKQPKWFVAEIVSNFPKMPIDGKDFPYVDILKTTTINGKTYLVGTYLYE